MERHKVIIIGAGLSGISAGSRLLENGIDKVVILEAEDRVGGRIHSIDYGSGKLDLGGQWIHGEKNNCIYEMVKDNFDLGTTAFDEYKEFFLISDGSVANQEKCTRLTEFSYEILEKSYSDMKIYNGSIGDFFTEKFMKLLNTSEYSDDLPSLIIDHVRRQTNSYYASPNWNDISAKLDAEYESATGNPMITWKDKGFITVFDYLKKKLPNPSEQMDVDSKILFNKKVVNVHYFDDENLTTVTCSDGSIYTADHVIITISLGVLKAQHKTLFTPPLPRKKIEVIESFGFGAIGKIFLEFAEPFWEESIESYSLLWKENDVNEIKTSDRAWLLDVVEFIKVDSFPNLLEAFVAGERMKTFEELSDEKIQDDCLWLLEKFMNTKLPKPTKIIRSKWLSNENFLGTYSYISMDLDKFKVGPKDLAEPLKKSDGRSFLHFAGEATDDKFPSYAHGAVMSGYRAAAEIISS